VTDTCQIIDKSQALIPWACKMMAQKILHETTKYHCMSQGSCNGEYVVPDTEFINLVLASKSAHREKLDAAAAIGHMAHDWIEQYIKADINRQKLRPQPPSHPEAANCCFAALDWMSKHNVRWQSTEQKVYSKKWRYAGTLDGMALVDSCGDTKCCRTAFKDRLSLIDWKSSNDLRIEYLLQTAAYLAAYTEEHGVLVEDRWIIRLGKDDGEFDPWHLEDSSVDIDFDAFCYALHLKRTLAAIEARMKGRANEIKLQHKAEKALEKQAALAIECDGYKTYKGIQKPRCNKGNPCQACLARYAAAQATKPKPGQASYKVKFVTSLGPDTTVRVRQGEL
jgi:hypothetical protein